MSRTVLLCPLCCGIVSMQPCPMLLCTHAHLFQCTHAPMQEEEAKAQQAANAAKAIKDECEADLAGANGVRLRNTPGTHPLILLPSIGRAILHCGCTAEQLNVHVSFLSERLHSWSTVSRFGYCAKL